MTKLSVHSLEGKHWDEVGPFCNAGCCVLAVARAARLLAMNFQHMRTVLEGMTDNQGKHTALAKAARCPLGSIFEQVQ